MIVKTSRIRQAFSIQFLMGLGLDPCGTYIGHMAVLTVLTKSSILGNNLRHKDNIRSNTVKQYIQEINVLHRLHGLEPPVPDFSCRSNPVAILISNMEKEEDIDQHRAPLTNALAEELIHRGSVSPFTSFASLIRDITVLAQEVGPRAAEIFQRTKNKVDYHTYPSGNQVVKALCAANFKFFDMDGKAITDPIG